MADRTPAAKKWLDEISSAQKRERKFRKTGEQLLEMWEGDRGEDTPYNILYSNTETLAPNLYSATPRPVVLARPRAKDDLVVAEASKIAKSLLDYLLDSNSNSHQGFDEVLELSVLDALLPGRGQATAEIEEDELCPRHVQWDLFCHGYAKRWCDVPWVAFGETITKELAREKWPKKADKFKFSRDSNSQSEGDPETGLVWKVWVKASRKVITLSEHFEEGIIEELDDPYQLRGFFPCIRPLTFIRKTHSLVPSALWTQYENQAKELNRLTVRINKIAEMIKVRGIYNGVLKEFQTLLSSPDGTMIPANQATALASQNADLDKAVWLMPVERIAAILMNLNQAREAVKMVIYEITGISDIMRGSTRASETLGAQQLKTEWGTARLRRMQRAVQAFVRDYLRLLLEMAVKNLSEDTVAKMTGGQLLSAEEKAQAVAQLEASMQAPAGPQGQQPDPKLLVAARNPSYAEVISLLQSDLERSYRLDIETNSTIDPEAADQQQQLTAAFTALSQVFTALGPQIEKGVLPFDVAKSFLVSTSRVFPMGSEMETLVRGLKAPEPHPDEALKKRIADQDQELKQTRLNLQVERAKGGLRDQEMALNKRDTELSLRELEINGLDTQATEKERMLKEKDTELATREAEVGEATEAAATYLPQQIAGLVQSIPQVVAQSAAQGQEAIGQALSQIGQGLAQLGQLLEAMRAEAAAPKEVIRDPKTNRIVGIAPRRLQ